MRRPRQPCVLTPRYLYSRQGLSLACNLPIGLAGQSLSSRDLPVSAAPSPKNQALATVPAFTACWGSNSGPRACEASGTTEPSQAWVTSFSIVLRRMWGSTLVPWPFVAPPTLQAVHTIETDHTLTLSMEVNLEGMVMPVQIEYGITLWLQPHGLPCHSSGCPVCLSVLPGWDPANVELWYVTSFRNSVRQQGVRQSIFSEKEIFKWNQEVQESNLGDPKVHIPQSEATLLAVCTMANPVPNLPAYLSLDFYCENSFKWEFAGLSLIFCQSLWCMLIISLTNSEQFMWLLPEDKIFYIFLFLISNRITSYFIIQIGLTSCCVQYNF